MACHTFAESRHWFPSSSLTWGISPPDISLPRFNHLADSGPGDVTCRQTRGELHGSVGLAASRAVGEWAVGFAQPALFSGGRLRIGIGKRLSVMAAVDGGSALPDNPA